MILRVTNTNTECHRGNTEFRRDKKQRFSIDFQQPPPEDACFRTGKMAWGIFFSGLVSAGFTSSEFVRIAVISRTEVSVDARADSLNSLVRLYFKL